MVVWAAEGGKSQERFYEIFVWGKNTLHFWNTTRAKHSTPPYGWDPTSSQNYARMGRWIVLEPSRWSDSVSQLVTEMVNWLIHGSGQEVTKDSAIPLERAQAELLMVAGEDDWNSDSVRCWWWFGFVNTNFELICISDMRRWLLSVVLKQEGLIWGLRYLTYFFLSPIKQWPNSYDLCISC